MNAGFEKRHRIHYLPLHLPEQFPRSPLGTNLPKNCLGLAEASS